MTVRTQSAPQLRVNVDDIVEELVSHPLYARVHDAESLRHFMASHVFCVWDFQSLLKGLQRRLTCVSVPWLPSGDPEARRLINEIVLDEESDAMPDGSYLSHFELYLNAMRQCGADAGPIQRLTESLRAGVPADRALADAGLPPGVADFVGQTLRIAEGDEIHRVAAAFTYGREDVIPAMFEQFVRGLAGEQRGRWELFGLYLTRHIEHDGERHGPLSRALVARLCGHNERLWREAEQTARDCLRSRLALWGHILGGLDAASN
jgi:hypothetical protein